MWFKVLLIVGLIGHGYGADEEGPILRTPELLDQSSSEIMVVLKDSVQPILRDLAARTFADRAARLNGVATALKAFTALSQAPVIAALKPFNLEITPFWATNRIHIQNGNPVVVKFLQTLKEIAEIRAPRFPSLPPINPIDGTPPNGTEWNVEIVSAPKVWELDNFGGGVIVAGIDTGVRYTHKAIAENYVGTENNGWFDPWYKTKNPTDNNGHGTHTIATVCGKTGTGVAPAAQWMACRSCETAGCPEKNLLACGQWTMCPTDSEGRNAKCEKAPHIVTNSWGGGAGDSFFDDIIAGWKTDGIVPIFAIGNDGPKCNTAASPGDRDGVLSVGATDKDDKIAKFSSRGPRKEGGGVVKPEVAAPGHKVNSAFAFSDNSYRVLSGTSMACPCVAGATALLMAKNPTLTLPDVMRLFYETADRDLQPSGTNCGDKTDSDWPNEVYGYGRINVYKAYQKLLAEMTTHEPTIGSTKV